MNVIVAVIKLIFLILASFLFLWSMMTTLKQINLNGVTDSFTFAQKIKRSLIAGCMLGITLLSVFAMIFVVGWTDSLPNGDFLVAIGGMMVCIVLPLQMMTTVGTFIQMTYLNFILRNAQK